VKDRVGLVDGYAICIHVCTVVVTVISQECVQVQSGPRSSLDVEESQTRRLIVASGATETVVCHLSNNTENCTLDTLSHELIMMDDLDSSSKVTFVDLAEIRWDVS
jgi:hypothetical protein